jgi:hypothetical protein
MRPRAEKYRWLEELAIGDKVKRPVMTPREAANLHCAAGVRGIRIKVENVCSHAWVTRVTL